jgi:bacillithiol biosynthesis deacetylase BshB1
MKVDILAFAAHPDDIELAASGTILKHIALGYKVAIIDLTKGELGSRGTAETRQEESEISSKILGISDRKNLDLGDGFFTHSQENLLKIVEQIRHFQPQIVLANAPNDRHPDHGKGSKLVADGCFLAGLLKIETTYDGEKQLPHRPKTTLFYIQDRYLKPDLIIDVTQFVDKKIECIKAFKTQFFDPESKEPNTPISGPEFMDFIKARLSDMGRTIGVKYGEGFITERTLGVDSFFDLR